VKQKGQSWFCAECALCGQPGVRHWRDEDGFVRPESSHVGTMRHIEARIARVEQMQRLHGRKAR
jgi:hypothetical protein